MGASPGREGTIGVMSVRRSILVGEDDELVADALSAFLRREGFAVEVRTDGREVLEAAGEGGYGAVLLDLRLPGLDGLAVLTRLRAAPETAGLPVFTMTASPSPFEARAALAVGATRHLVKPFSLVDLARDLGDLCPTGASPGGED